MKTIIAAVLMFLIALLAFAGEQPDTTAARELQEVVVKAPKVIRKDDMDVYYPSKSAVDNSRNGMQLINNLMIPSLTVTEPLGQIQAAGEGVQVRINGREATLEQLKSIDPSTVKRVEWIDNPGLRYRGARNVLNVIVSNPTAGGSLQAEAEPALNTAWGYCWADLKLNTGRSQWKMGGNFKLTENLKSHREFTETFTFPDGSKLTRDETSRGGSLDNTMGSAWLSYNYIKPDTTMVYIGLQTSHVFSNQTTYDGLMTLSDGTDGMLLHDSSGSKGTTPWLSAYFEQHFPGKQTLVVDFKSSLYFGKTYSDYTERHEDQPGYLTDIHTMIRDRNRAYAVEADYIKHWRNSRFTAGASYSANRNRSEYENLDGRIFHQRQDKVYLFAEYFHRLGKVTLTAGMGAQYTDFMFRETGQGNSSWNMRPQATVTYAVNGNHQLRLSFETWQSTPSLAETNVAPQQIDAFQWRMGNPALKTSNSYMLTLRYGFNVPRVAGSFGIRAFSSPDAITPLLYWDNDRLVTTYENSRGLRNLTLFLAPQIDIIPGWLKAGGYVQYRLERMRGTGYDLTSANWSGHVNLSVTHRGFVLSCSYLKARRDLWGEKISWGESLSVVDLSYNWRNWQFGAGMLMPFGRYDQGSESLSRWNTNEQRMRLDMRMPYIKIGYNLQWGRQKNAGRKLINADANVDTSTAGGR